MLLNCGARGTAEVGTGPVACRGPHAGPGNGPSGWWISRTVGHVRWFSAQLAWRGGMMLHRRPARIGARIAPEALSVVKRAAEIQGRSLSDFVVAAAQEAAHRTIEETTLIRLSAKDQRRFVELLLDPPALAP